MRFKAGMRRGGDNKGRFLCVGFLEERPSAKCTEETDLKGWLALPGLIDGHTHPETAAKSRRRVQTPEFDNRTCRTLSSSTDENTRQAGSLLFRGRLFFGYFDEKGLRKPENFTWNRLGKQVGQKNRQTKYKKGSCGLCVPRLPFFCFPLPDSGM